MVRPSPPSHLTPWNELWRNVQRHYYECCCSYLRGNVTIDSRRLLLGLGYERSEVYFRVTHLYTESRRAHEISSIRGIACRLVRRSHSFRCASCPFRRNFPANVCLLAALLMIARILVPVQQPMPAWVMSTTKSLLLNSNTFGMQWTPALRGVSCRQLPRPVGRAAAATTYRACITTCDSAAYQAIFFCFPIEAVFVRRYLLHP